MLKLKEYRADIVILAAWLASAGLVVSHERGGLFGHTINPITALTAPLEVREQWFGLYYKGHKIGFSQSTVAPDDFEGMPGVAVTERGRVAFTLMGIPQQLDLAGKAFFDADWRLLRFSASIQSEAYNLTWSGRRRGDDLIVEVEAGKSRYITKVHDPANNTMVVGLAPWAAFRRLQPGQWGKFWVLNPLALNPEPVYFTVRSMEVFQGRPTLMIETDFRGIASKSFVTLDGEVIKEESPLGWELVRESREEAMKAATAAPTLDLLSSMAVPMNRLLPTPAMIERMVWLIRGAERDDMPPDRAWQRLLPDHEIKQYAGERPAAPWVLVELRRPVRPDADAGEAAPHARYLRASPFVQADDPRVRALAEEIVGPLTDPWDQAQAISRWLHANITKRLTVGLPTAVDVLLSRSGDCHEHTVLFAGLARSLGIPTRLVAGLVYLDGQLFYHAWPEVWAGSWAPLDPTLGQPVADATHLGLVEAEDEQLVSLGKFIGQLKVDVLLVEDVVPDVVPAP